MGLDMNLYRKTYIGGNYDHNKIEGEISLTRHEIPIKIDKNKVAYITEDVGYWRKANAIHKWFVDNVQNGEDDCREYDVSAAKLRELRELCLKVLETKDATDLPPQSGFFFGSTNIDEGYFDDLRDTVNIIESLGIVPSNTEVFITEKDYQDDPNVSYIYSSSW